MRVRGKKFTWRRRKEGHDVSCPYGIVRREARCIVPLRVMAEGRRFPGEVEWQKGRIYVMAAKRGARCIVPLRVMVEGRRIHGEVKWQKRRSFIAGLSGCTGLIIRSQGRISLRSVRRNAGIFSVRLTKAELS